MTAGTLGTGTLGAGTLGSPVAAASTAPIAGIEGIHAWTPPGAAEPAIELGRVLDDEGAKVWPRYEIKRITGLMGTGEPEDNRDRPPRRGLEIPRLSQRRGKTVVYEGLIKALTLIQLEEATAVMRAAFDDLSTEGRMDVDWHPLLRAARELSDIPPKFFEARALTCEIVDVQEGKGWVRSYVVGTRLGDRRYFDSITDVFSVEIAESNVPVEVIE